MTARADIAALALSYLDEHLVGTVEQIARSIRCRNADVRAVMRDDKRFLGPLDLGKAPHVKSVFCAPHRQRDRLGRVA